MFNPYAVIKYPLITEKTTALADENKYVFIVVKNAGKNQVKMAIEQIYKVSVMNVSIVNMPGKKRKYRLSREGYRPAYKKAIITLKEGDKIAIT